MWSNKWFHYSWSAVLVVWFELANVNRNDDDDDNDDGGDDDGNDDEDVCWYRRWRPIDDDAPTYLMGEQMISPLMSAEVQQLYCIIWIKVFM